MHAALLVLTIIGQNRAESPQEAFTYQAQQAPHYMCYSVNCKQYLAVGGYSSYNIITGTADKSSTFQKLRLTTVC